MSRRFSADNSEIRWNIVAATDLTSAWTVAMIVCRRNTGAWNALLAHHDSAGAVKLAVEFDNTDHLSVETNTTNTVSATTYTSTSDWLLIAASKAAGTVAVRLQVKNLTTGAVIVRANLGLIPNASSCTGGTMRVGEYADADDANINVAVLGAWNAVLSDAQVDELYANNRTSDWYNNTAGVPRYLYELNQATATDSVPDLAANGGTWSLTNGTTVEGASDPPSWNYNGTGSVTATPPSLAMAPRIPAY